jgi:8-oxo-dGTP pyrophosphatase MutT (NUDIX family)
MKNSWPKIGTAAFWISWPALWLYLHFSERTRVLVIYKDKVLVVRSWLGDGKWSLPGGGLHHHEAPLSGVLREMQEETSVVLQPKQLHELKHEHYRDKGFSFDCHFFFAEIVEQMSTQRQKGEIIAVTWLDWRMLTTLNASNDVLYSLDVWRQQA